TRWPLEWRSDVCSSDLIRLRRSPSSTATAKDGKRRSRMALGTSVGGLVYATGQGLAGIYQARAHLLTQIPAKSELLAKAGQATSPVPLPLAFPRPLDYSHDLIPQGRRT